MSQEAVLQHPRRRFDATAVLTVYLVLLVGLPSRLIVAPLGAAGTPATLVGLLCLLWWGAARLTDLGSARSRQPLRSALAVFGLVLLLSYTTGMLQPTAGVEQRSADRLLLSIAAWAGVALLCSDGVSGRDGLERLVRRMVLAGALLALVGLADFVTGLDVAQHVRVPGLVANHPVESIQLRADFRRVAGTALHPIEFGVVLALLLPLALRQAVQDRRWRARLPALLLAAAIPTSLSRSAILGSVGAMLVLLTGWTWRRRANFLVVGLGFLCVQRLAVPGLLGTLRSLFVNIREDPSTTGRTDDYSQVWASIAHSPVLGRGTGTYVPELHRILDNQYLLTLIESGALGLLALVGLLVTGIGCARSARHGTHPPTRELGQALAASVTAGAVSLVTYDAFSFPMATGMLFLVLGCCGCVWRLAHERPVPVPLPTARATGARLP